MTGIATLTKQYVDIAKPYNVMILDTRKTMPGLRFFDKYAVNVGGGTNHRSSLSAAILIKDNHLQAGNGIKQVIESINEQNKEKYIVELEVDNIDQLREGLDLNIKAFLLDNMSPDMIKNAISIIRKQPNGDDIFVEASGGITLDNLHQYVSTGINAISVGAITHSVTAANIHINFKK